MAGSGVYRTRTDEEIEKLATDVLGEKVFTSNHVKHEDSQLLDHIFMNLLFLSEDDKKALVADNITMLYEYLSEAGPQRFKDYPTFLSAQGLSRLDMTRLQGVLLRKVEETRAEVKEK